MEFNFSLRRSLLLAALLGAFALFGGFSAPEMSEYHHSRHVSRAWFMCIVLFVGGAVSFSIIEHTIGLMDPTNLRPAYVFIGLVLMLSGVLWLRALKEGVDPKSVGLLLNSNGVPSGFAVLIYQPILVGIELIIGNPAALANGEAGCERRAAVCDTAKT
jgi:hypothetical protein